MTIGGPSIALRVFLASPGDVAEERAFVREFLESILPNDPLLPGRVTFKVVSWDHPHAGTPMPAALTPQEAVIRFKGRPSDCDLTVVILAARLGTHLAVDAFKRPDGSAYLSGTEWEYEDARNATPPRDILVYRRTDLPPIALRDPDRKEKLRQYELVEQCAAGEQSAAARLSRGRRSAWADSNSSLMTCIPHGSPIRSCRIGYRQHLDPRRLPRRCVVHRLRSSDQLGFGRIGTARVR
jgi:hypothetical protein